MTSPSTRASLLLIRAVLSCQNEFFDELCKEKFEGTGLSFDGL